MTTTDWIQAISMVVLVGVTIFYAYQAKKASGSAKASADASVKMAEAIHKPLIVLESNSGTRGQYFMKKIGVGVGNEGQGLAINVELHIAHPFFKFDTFCYPHPIRVKEDPIKHEFDLREPSADEEPGIEITPIALVVANYEDVLGNPWHSTLELIWDATKKDITPGRTQVAISGHYKGEDNSS